MASTDTQWMPTTGKHSVAVGSSLRRALKARKGAAPPKRSHNLPDKDFYSFRYNFKPESIDHSKSGTVEVNRGKESTSIALERPSTQAGENHVFKGAEQPVKEYDCVLIYDEELGTFTLEKIDCFVSFTYDKKVSSSSSSFARKSPSAISGPSGQLKDLEKELERDLLGLTDADGDGVDDLEEVLPKVTGGKQEEEEEEEEEGEEIEIPTRKAPSPPPKPKASRPVVPPPKKREPEQKPRPKPKEVPKTKREVNTYGDDFEVEEFLDFGVPARASKLQKPSTTTALALPGTSSSFLPPAPPTKPIAGSDSEEEEWDEVTNNEPVEEEIDVNAFELEMELELEESDEDILAAAMSPEPDSVANGPMSPNQYVGGQLSADEDDTSSSEDSDED